MTRRTLVSHQLRPFDTGDRALDSRLDEHFRESQAHVFEKIRYYDKHSPASTHEITAAEIAAGVTPTNYAYPPGNLLRYGADPTGVADSTTAVRNLALLSSYSLYAPTGTFKLTGTVQFLADVTWQGANLELTKLTGAFAGHVLEIGNGTVYGNCGLIEGIQIVGGASNLSLLHVRKNVGVGSPPALWSIDRMLFKDGACPAILLDRMWDSTFGHIEILNCQGAGTNPATAASVIFNNDTNNIYFGTLRQDGIGASIYVDNCGPIYVKSGKIDRGGVASQQFAAVTVSRGVPNTTESFYGGSLSLDNFYFGGVVGQWPIDLGGSLKLGKVLIDGGSDKTAAINDRRVWQQSDPLSFNGISAPNIGPFISTLDLGQARFNRSHPSLNTITPAAVTSKIHPIRKVENLTVSANGATTATTRNIATSLTAAVNGLYIGLYLVHNADGYKSTSRRKILASFTDGSMTIQGTAAAVLDSDYSLEFAGGHCTPIQADHVALESGMDLFAVIATGATISGPAYDSSSGDATYGSTTVTLTASGVGANDDLKGFYLIDEVDCTPYFINAGNTSNVIGVLYDVSAIINTSHTYSIVAGYKSGVRVEGAHYVWTFSNLRKRALVTTLRLAGFDAANVPLWGDFSGCELAGSATYDPPNLIDGAGTTTTVTVTGAALGDFVDDVSFSLDLQGISVTAYVSAADTVSVRFQNESGGALDLASGTLRAIVRKV